MNKKEQICEIKQRITSLRRRMIGLRSDDHWLCIDQLVRKALEEAFFLLNDNEISEVIGMPTKTIERWRKEKDHIIDLKKRLAECRLPGKSKLSHTVFFRPEIAALAKKTPLRLLSRELGLPKTSIMRWRNEKWDAVASDKLPKTYQPKGTIPADDEKKKELETSSEGKELFLLLERRSGKPRRKYTTSEKKLIVSLVDRYGSKLVHEEYKVSFDTIARLLRNREREIERKPRIPVRYAPVLELMKQHPGMGPMQMRDFLRRHYGLSMGVNSIRKVMEANGWVPPFTRSPRIKGEEELFEAVRRNYLWHMDFKHQYINNCKVFLLFIQDDFSRFIVNFAIADGEKLDAVIECFDDAVRRHGKPECVMTDGGSAFYSWRGISQITRLFEDFGIDQHIAKTPNVNGKIENLNQQFEKEVLLTMSFSSLQHFEKEVASWVGFYNFRRPHQGLGSAHVPADRYFPGAERWYGGTSEITKQQSLIAETMATLLNELRKPSV